MNLIGGFQALGTLLAVGIMMLPAVICRFWARDISRMIVIAIGCAALSGYAGLLALLPRQPAVGPGGHSGRRRALCRCRLCSAPVGGLIWRLVPMRHLEA